MGHAEFQLPQGPSVTKELLDGCATEILKETMPGPATASVPTAPLGQLSSAVPIAGGGEGSSAATLCPPNDREGGGQERLAVAPAFRIPKDRLGALVLMRHVSGGK